MTSAVHKSSILPKALVHISYPKAQLERVGGLASQNTVQKRHCFVKTRRKSFPLSWLMSSICLVICRSPGQTQDLLLKSTQKDSKAPKTARHHQKVCFLSPSRCIVLQLMWFQK